MNIYLISDCNVPRKKLPIKTITLLLKRKINN